MVGDGKSSNVRVSATVIGLSYDNQGVFNNWSRVVQNSWRYSHEHRRFLTDLLKINNDSSGPKHLLN